MRQASKGQGGPASSPLNGARDRALDRELADLERRKLLTLQGGTIRLTRAGYRELVRRFPRRQS